MFLILDNPRITGFFVQEDLNDPYNFIDEENISVYEDKIVLEIWWATYFMMAEDNSQRLWEFGVLPNDGPPIGWARQNALPQ